MQTGSWTISEPVVHRCPVCKGKGLVTAGFYSQTSGEWSSTKTASEKCRSCYGNGCIVIRGEVNSEGGFSDNSKDSG